MRLSLIKSSVCPPDGFRYVFPEDGYTVHAWDYNTWIEIARHHLRANNMAEPANLQELMENQICQTLEPGWCSYDDPNRPRVSTSLSWDDVKGFLETFKSWIGGGLGFTSQEEAERRALICARCYMNTHIGGCAACQKLVTEVIGKKVTRHDHMLKACAVCRCVLRAKVHFPQKVLDKQAQKHQEVYPEHCWLKKDGPNYVGDPSNTSG
jgi:hypothetical protein